MTFWAVDVNGNRLGIVRADRGEDLATLARCALRRERGALDVSDGVAAFRGESSDLHFAFCNPDGSEEQFCGNALLAIAALWGPPGGAELQVRARAKSVPRAALRCEDRRVRLTVRLDAPIGSRRLKTELGEGVNVDVGTPHLVIRSSATAGVEEGVGRKLVARTGLNVTLCTVDGDVVNARTFERGLWHETASCGSGAIAIGAALTNGRARRWLIRYTGGEYLCETRREGGALDATLSIVSTTVAVRRECLRAQRSPVR